MSISRIISVSLKGLSKYKMRTFLMMLGIIIGIAALTVIVSIGEGSKRQVMERMKKMGAAASLMVRPGAGTKGGVPVQAGITTLTPEDAKAIEEEITNIKNIAPVMMKRNVSVKYGNKNTTTKVFGVMPVWRVVRTFDVERGEFISENDITFSDRMCLLGQQVVQDLFGSEDPIGESVSINNVGFQVKGVLEKKGSSASGHNLDDRILVPLSTFSKRLFNQTYLNQIVIQLSNVSAMYETAGEVKALLRERHHLTKGESDDFIIRIPKEAMKTRTEVSTTMTILLSLIAGISLIVGGVVVMNIMLISVNERKLEIGLRRTAGATKRDILLQFFVEALFVTLTGGILGVFSGIGASKITSLIAGIPTVITWLPFAIGIIFSTVVGIIFGIKPARRAAALEPVEALHV
ncbi:MAG TPA: FtsX-like permease family protein [Nitrospirae bacterium]|nr:FtsX-like permease family protein [Nitrospirota bacterium]